MKKVVFVISFLGVLSLSWFGFFKEKVIAAGAEKSWTPLTIKNTSMRYIDGESQYSLDLRGSEKILLYAIDHRQKDKSKSVGEINSRKTIKKLTNLAAQLPKNGKVEKDHDRVNEIDVIGVKSGFPVAHFKLMGSDITSENGNFYSEQQKVGDKTVLQIQKQIVEIIESHLSLYKYHPIEKELETLGNKVIKYSQNFSGAQRILLRSVSHHKKGHPEKYGEIKDPKKVARVIEILASLPVDGNLMVSWGPVEVVRVMAVKNGDVFAQVSLYSGLLKTEGTGFLQGDDQQEKLQKELDQLAQSHL